MIRDMQARGLTVAEPELDAQERWTEHVYDVYAMTLLADSDAWWVRQTPQPDGSVRKRALIYVGGAPQYRDLCDGVAQQGYTGFALS